MSKYQSSKQISIEDFVLSFSGSLNKKNKWVILAHVLPWDEMVMKRDRRAIEPYVAIDSLIIYHFYQLMGGIARMRYNLDNVNANRQDTSESWIRGVYLVMKISQFYGKFPTMWSDRFGIFCNKLY